VDIIGDASAQRFSDAVSIAAKDPGSDGLLVILTPQAMTDPLQVAEGLRPYARLGKPLLASWMGGPLVDAGRNVLNTAGIPTFDYPDTAARMFQYMWSYTENLRGLYETPAADPDPDAKVTQAATLIAAAAAAGRTVLSELESKELLSYYGIPVTRTTLARTVDEAVSAAHGIGYPVVLKLHSHTVTHKTEAGGVHLNLGGPAQVQQAFAAIQAGVPAEAFQGVTVQPMERLQGVELILGSSVDPQFGPVLLFGAGGTLVEILEDKALGLPPLTSTLARRMMEQTRIHKALKGFRGRPPVDQAHLETLLVRFSRLVVEQPRIAEIEINPLLVSAERIVGLDARVVLHPAAVTEPPRPAIRPYPSQYVSQWIARGGTPLRLRPIRPEDEQLMVKFHESVSDHSVYLRYFQFLKLSQRVAHERLVRICFNDYDREIALVAERLIGPEPTIIGVGRLRKTSEEQAELGLLIIDSAQGMGLGTEMVRRLIEIGRLEGLRSIHADVHSENPKMLHLLRKFGFKMAIEPGDPVLTGQLIL
jgi:acetyltransferase